MILTDANLLLNAYNRDFPAHLPARRWWESVLNDRESIGLSWITILGFIRVMTNPKAMPNPMTLEAAVSAVESWLSQPNVEIVEPGPRHREILFRLLREAGAAGNLSSDAHLAAIALEQQARLASADTDFARFSGLRWFNPLVKKTSRNSASGRTTGIVPAPRKGRKKH